MALSGSFTGTSSNQYVQPKIVWSATQSQSGNYSDVTATLYYSRTNSGYTTYGTWSGGIVINGVTTTASKALTITQNSNTQAVSATVRVSHNSDGTKSITISAYGGISGTSFSSTSISQTVALNAISRGTVPTVSGTLSVGSTVTISVSSRASSSYTHDLSYSWGSSLTNQTIVSGFTDTTYSWTIPKLLAEYLKNATSGTLTLKCITKNGSSTVGEQNIKLTISIPDTAEFRPKITNVEFSDHADLPIDELIAGKTEPMITASFAGGKADGGGYNSWVENITISCQNQSYSYNYQLISGMTYTAVFEPLIGWSDTFNAVFTITVTDSRGRKATQTLTKTLYGYEPPKITDFKARRCDADGNIDDDGQYLSLYIRTSVTSINAKNDKRFAFTYKTSSGESQIMTGTLASYVDEEKTYVTTTTFSGDSSWTIYAYVYDSFNTATPAEAESTVPVASVFMDWKGNGKGIAFGKVSTRDGLECKLPMYFYEDINLVKVEDGAETVIDFDYVVEYGIYNGWSYRKWRSGYAECWIRHEINDVPCDAAVGSWYRTATITPNDYPFAFITAPTVNMYFETNSGTGGLVWTAGTNGSASLTKPDNFYVIRMISATSITGAINISARGKWK